MRAQHGIALVGAVLQANNMEDTFATFGVRPLTMLTLGGIDLLARGMLGRRHTFGSVMPQSVVAFTSREPKWTIPDLSEKVPPYRAGALLKAFVAGNRIQPGQRPALHARHLSIASAKPML